MFPLFSASLNPGEGEFRFFFTPKGCRAILFPESKSPLLSQNAVKISLKDDSFFKQKFLNYFKGLPQDFKDIPLDMTWASPFTLKVLMETRNIPWGKTLSYGELAARIDCPKGARAVGAALRSNQLPVIIPCHRVIGKDGGLTGFAAGMEWKKKLLTMEKIKCLK